MSAIILLVGFVLVGILMGYFLNTLMLVISCLIFLLIFLNLKPRTGALHDTMGIDIFKFFVAISGACMIVTGLMVRISALSLSWHSIGRVFLR